MLFNSVIFITVFLPLVLSGWYLLQKIENPVYSKAFLLAMSLWFYGYYNPYYLLLLGGSLLANFSFSFLFEKITATGWRKMVFLLSLATNIGILFYFKYFNFFIDNCNFFLHTDWNIEKIALPLGISFYSFQQISFVVDRYRNKAPHYSFLDYGCFVTFFPQLIAGPIVLHDEFIPELQKRAHRKIDKDLFFDGTALFILGLGKKVLLADVLAIPANAEFSNIANLDAPSAWLTLLLYTFELYFDFSGYCDMARGLGKMFGFTLPENFDSPFKADSVTDFWRRWHKTLSRFLTTYIYIPLGGSRKGTAIKCRNLFILFLVSGIWHGANWTYIVWGISQGIAMIWETLFPKLRFRSTRINKLLTFLYFILTLVIFRSDSLSSAFLLYKKMFTGGFTGFIVGMCNVLQIPETYAIQKALDLFCPQLINPFLVVCNALLILVSVLLTAGPKAEQWIATKGRTTKGLLILATVFTWAVISLSQVSTFLYFNF